jgi:hypothetical protein
MKKGMMNTYGAKPTMSGRTPKPGAAKMPRMPAKPTMSARPVAAKPGAVKKSALPARMRNR